MQSSEALAPVLLVEQAFASVLLFRGGTSVGQVKPQSMALKYPVDTWKHA